MCMLMYKDLHINKDEHHGAVKRVKNNILGNSLIGIEIHFRVRGRGYGKNMAEEMNEVDDREYRNCEFSEENFLDFPQALTNHRRNQ